MRQAVFDARWILPMPDGVYARELALRLPALLPDWRFAFLARPDADADAFVPPDAAGRAAVHSGRARIAARKLAGASPACASRSSRAVRRSSVFRRFGSRECSVVLSVA